MSFQEVNPKSGGFELRSRIGEIESFESPGRSSDEVVLARFGKRQQLRRGFKSISTIGLVCALQCTWEALAIGLFFGLQNGGPAGLVYGFILCWCGAFLQALVMAEMASMIPLAGGPFNWVAILSPSWCRKFLSYITGWLTMMAWQSLVATACYLTGVLVQAIVQLNYPDYVYERWHGTMLFWAFLAIALLFNTWLAHLLPALQILMLIIHVCGFIGIMIPMVYLAPHNSASMIFTQFENYGDWSSTGLAFMVGLITSLQTLTGVDGADHIAEEIRGATRVIPLSMISAMIINGLTGISFLFAMLFCMGDIDVTINTPTGFPFIEIFTHAVGSTAGGTAMACIVTFAEGFSAIGILATASRMMWAFAREKGVPFASYVSKVDPSTRLPLWAIGITGVINFLLALINIGSSAAFQAFVSLLVASYYASFLIAAGVMLHKRLTTPTSELPWGVFRLGRAGIPVTILAMCWTFLALFFSFWPTLVSPTPEAMNWSILLFGAALVFSLLFWVVQGRHVYKGPIMEVSVIQSRDAGVDIVEEQGLKEY